MMLFIVITCALTTIKAMELMTGSFSFDAGEAQCINNGYTHLATILTRSDDKEAGSLCTNTRLCRFGLEWDNPSQPGTTWAYSSGEPKGYTHWAGGQGDEAAGGQQDGYCANYNNYEWHDWACSNGANAICDGSPITATADDISWTLVPSAPNVLEMPWIHSNHRGFYSSVDKSIYMIGNSPNPWRLDMSTLTWCQDRRLPNIDQSVKLVYQSGVAVNNIYYFIDNDNPSKIGRFDATQDTPIWEREWVDFGQDNPRKIGKCLTANGVDTLYALAGYNNQAATNPIGYFKKININDGTVTAGTPHQYGEGISCGYYDNHVYIMGGSLFAFRRIDVRNWDTMSWSAGLGAPNGRMAEAVLIDDVFWWTGLYGGHQATGLYRFGLSNPDSIDITFEQTSFDGTLDQYSRSFAGIVFSEYDNRMYAVGGQGRNTQTYEFSNRLTVMSDYELILRHKDTRRGYFNQEMMNTGIENVGNPDANTYSIVGQVNSNDYKDSDGYYRLKTVYGIDDGSTVTLEWKQTSWITENIAEAVGFIPISIPSQSTSCTHCIFKGLSHDTGATQDDLTYLDGDNEHEDTWNSIGRISAWSTDRMPAFNEKKAFSCTLYVFNPSGVAVDNSGSKQCPTEKLDCKLGGFSEWSSCNGVCQSDGSGGDGTQYRTQLIVDYPENGGTACPSVTDRRETQNCNSCPANCIEGTWSNWSICDAECDGEGKETRTRTGDIAEENGGTPCNPHIEERTCNGPICCPNGIGTFNWDTLTAKAEGIPYSDATFDVEEGDLSLNIVVELDYVGAATADNEREANFGVTYVLDFEDFSAHKDKINEPGTCQNRKDTSFNNKNFNEYWTYSLEPEKAGNVGVSPYLAYGPPGDKWTVSMKENACNIVVYSGHFTWNDLRNCEQYGGGPSYTKVIADDKWLNLTGTFYINLVSPFWYKTTDTGYYRVYQLLSQPFVIAVSSTIYVVGSTGINLMTMSIIAVYKENDESVFKLVIMTESADYMRLIRDNSNQFVFKQDDNNKNNFDDTNFAASISAENTNCLENKDFLCSQLWEIEATDILCKKGVSGTDFSGLYAMTFYAECKDGINNNHCKQWLIDHDMKDKQISLSAPLIWKDDICDPMIFKVELSAEMIFYADIDESGDIYKDNNKIPNDYLYQVGEDPIYIEIVTDFPDPDTTLTIFNTKLVNVWICTFGPGINVPTEITTDGSAETMTSMGCFNAQRDKEYDDKFYHIFSTTQTINIDHSFNRDTTETISNIIRFSFVVPNEVARDTLYVHAQIEVELQELTTTTPPRRMLLNVNTANRMQHFGDEIGINHGEKHKKHKHHPPPKERYEPLSNPSNPTSPTTVHTLSLSLTWIIIIAGLLGLILTFNIIFMCYTNCCNNKKTGRGGIISYESVKNTDSEYIDDEELNHLNII